MSQESDKRLTILETSFKLQIEMLNDKFDRLEAVLEKIEVHIGRSVGYNERVNSMVGQQASIMTRLNKLTDDVTHHKEEDLAFHTKIKTWAGAGMLLVTALWSITQFVLPLFIK